MKSYHKGHFPRINKDGAKHLYDIGVETDTEIGQVEVEATNRDQATRIAESAGYIVRDVNMVG